MSTPARTISLPTTTPDGAPLLAAVRLGGDGAATLSAHVVMYARDDAHAVNVLVHGERGDYLADGAYDLTFGDALSELARRTVRAASMAR